MSLIWTHSNALNKEDLEHIVKAIAQNNIQVTTVETKRKKSYPQALFNLTDLQQEAYRRFKMGPKETLNTLQNLYERHKLVTYPRTDSNF